MRHICPMMSPKTNPRVASLPSQAQKRRRRNPVSMAPGRTCLAPDGDIARLRKFARKSENRPEMVNFRSGCPPGRNLARRAYCGRWHVVCLRVAERPLALACLFSYEPVVWRGSPCRCRAASPTSSTGRRPASGTKPVPGGAGATGGSASLASCAPALRRRAGAGRHGTRTGSCSSDLLQKIAETKRTRDCVAIQSFDFQRAAAFAN